ncbi:MAG: 2-amino-4-hydroxy-6-hydroxymethyldihydropteridine diphosphokinase [bacterium]
MKFRHVYLGLGSNMGDRLNNLQEALSQISNLSQTVIDDYSSVYETKPVGYAQQADFLNMVVEISTDSPPQPFLCEVQEIEKRLGRVRGRRWGPRTIDIDILYWGRELVNTHDLTIPHAEVENRRFVLQPLNEIASYFKTPPRQQVVKHLLEIVQDESWVILYLPKEKIEFTK